MIKEGTYNEYGLEVYRPNQIPQKCARYVFDGDETATVDHENL